MALDVQVTIDEKPIPSEVIPDDFLFAPGRLAQLYQGDEKLQFLNLKAPGIALSVPLHIHGGMPGKKILMPPYIPYYAIDVQINPTLSIARRTSVQRHIYTALAKKLDELNPALIELNFMPFYWLPFHWAGYEVRPRVTYRLETTPTTPQKIFSQFRDNIQRQIRKSTKENKVKEGSNNTALFALNRESYQRKGDYHPFDIEDLNQLFRVLKEDNCGKIIEIHDANDQVVAAALFAWDAVNLYYLTGGVLKSAKNSGAMAHVLWEGIQLARELGLTFDFEGSMNKGIEQFFSAFGATPFTYYQVRKSNSKLYDLYQSIKS